MSKKPDEQVPPERPEERRTTPRVPALLRVDYPNLSRFMADYSENISQNGLFIATDQKHEIGDEVDFQISFPGLLQPLQLHGRVRWRRPITTEEGKPGIGVELLFEAEHDRVVVEQLAKNAAAAQAQTLAPPTETSAPPPDRTFRILLAEDNPHVREMFSYGMTKLSQVDLDNRVKIEVVESIDGSDAWERIVGEAFDLLIIDIYMPVLDGHAVIRRVRGSDKHRWLPIVAVSAGTEARVEALESGADIFLPKPVKLSDILVTVKTLLRLGS